jgi:hypothetical protein
MECLPICEMRDNTYLTGEKGGNAKLCFYGTARLGMQWIWAYEERIEGTGEGSEPGSWKWYV